MQSRNGRTRNAAIIALNHTAPEVRALVDAAAAKAAEAYYATPEGQEELSDWRALQSEPFDFQGEQERGTGTRGTRRMSESPRRGEIYQADLNPVIGSELEKSRPVIVINKPKTGRPTMRLCVPLTDWKADAALLNWCVTISDTTKSGLRKLSLADVSQIRALDIRRFETKLGKADAIEVEAIAAALARISGYISDDE